MNSVFHELWWGTHRFSSRAMFLACEHGHLDTSSGAVTSQSKEFFLTHINHLWGGVLLGEVYPTRPSEGSITRGFVVDSASSLHALCELITELRQVREDVKFGLHIEQPGAWDDALLANLCEHLDWVEYDLTELTGDVLERTRVLFQDSDTQLAVSVGLDPDEGVEQLELPRALLAQVNVTSAPVLVHVSFARDAYKHCVAGSERASAKLGKLAQQLVQDTPHFLMVSGRIKHAEDGRRVLDFHGASFIGMTRAALAEPQILRRDAERKMSIFCTGCMACVPEVSRAVQAVLPQRMCNLHVPSSFDASLMSGKSLAMIGASYMALTMAEQAALAGATQVTVYTMGVTQGGLMRLRGRIPGQAESAEAVFQRLEQCRAQPVIQWDNTPYQAHELVEKIANEPVDEVFVSLMPDMVFCADGTGLPDVQQLDAMRVLQEGSTRRAYPDMSFAHPIIVLGTDLFAADLALYIRMQDHPVWYVSEQVAGDSHEAWQEVCVARLKDRGVEMLDRLPCEGETLPESWEKGVYVVDTRGGFQVSGLERELVSTLGRDVTIVRDTYEPLALLKMVQEII